MKNQNQHIFVVLITVRKKNLSKKFLSTSISTIRKIMDQFVNNSLDYEWSYEVMRESFTKKSEKRTFTREKKPSMLSCHQELLPEKVKGQRKRIVNLNNYIFKKPK